MPERQRERDMPERERERESPRWKEREREREREMDSHAQDGKQSCDLISQASQVTSAPVNSRTSR
jgi:hypothetical protein